MSGPKELEARRSTRGAGLERTRSHECRSFLVQETTTGYTGYAEYHGFSSQNALPCQYTINHQTISSQEAAVTQTLSSRAIIF